MASFNKVILIGYLTAAPELKQTQSGESVTSFSIGVSRKYSKNNESDFINIVAWKNTAEFISRYFKKGDPILVCGRIQTRTWTDNQGQKRYATEVVADEASFVVNKAEESSDTPPNPASLGGNGNTPSAYGGNQQYEPLPNDSDLPF